VTVNSYNFWHLFLGDKAANPSEWFLFLPYKIWGSIGVIGSNLAGWWIYVKGKKSLGTPTSMPSYHLPFQKRDYLNNNIWAALMVVGVGTWLFGMNMLERYLFAGIGFGLIACIQYRKLFWPWLAMSLMFFVNLYKHWWQPTSLDFLRVIHEEMPLVSQ
jgi:hypothetical protein